MVVIPRVCLYYQILVGNDQMFYICLRNAIVALLHMTGWNWENI